MNLRTTTATEVLGFLLPYWLDVCVQPPMYKVLLLRVIGEVPSIQDDVFLKASTSVASGVPHSRFMVLDAFPVIKIYRGTVHGVGLHDEQKLTLFRAKDYTVPVPSHMECIFHALNQKLILLMTSHYKLQFLIKGLKLSCHDEKWSPIHGESDTCGVRYLWSLIHVESDTCTQTVTGSQSLTLKYLLHCL